MANQVRHSILFAVDIDFWSLDRFSPYSFHGDPSGALLDQRDGGRQLLLGRAAHRRRRPGPDVVAVAPVPL